ncbi:D-alanine--D-alanine ligase [Actinoplanes sp. LDG1-06]|uniref:D-alanine--D-alanine ligase n=1 Tax=Paractinoplanes ovalisporus TaxID=2810368 RepID=A0ABS2ALG6_9ACTN|nr:D-alanine--D-alanine ligase family protein [Actinoplanes ovalisporus]MBM2620694.1 D-alanine--D-alanine ligase [Actinoplanes ovalisporus]
MTPVKLALIYGGRSGEHDVSRKSARSILDHLDPRAYHVTELLIARDGQWHVDGRPVPLAGALRVIQSHDVAFPALHGPYGEDGRLQAMLEWLGTPYVGNGVFASAAGMDKVVTKKLLAADGLRVATGVTLAPGDDDRPDGLELPVFVKPARAGSSLGVSRVDEWGSLPSAVREAREFDPKVLVEQAVAGREIDVAVLQHPDGRIEAGPPLEITVSGGFFDYAAKYDGGAVFQIPARIDDATTRLLQDRAIRAFHALGCRGLLRVDFFVPDSDEPVINEVNTFPGMTAASQYPQMWQQAGLSFTALLDVLIAAAAT